MHFDILDELAESQPWQPLECILTVWIEMIQRGKAVALHDDVCKAGYDSSDWQQDEGGNWQEIKGPQRDPATGAIRIGQASPWTIVPWTKQDLADCLEVWEMAIALIEEKMSLPPHEHDSGLVVPASFDVLPFPDGFAKQFLLQAKKPRFSFIAPGLRVPTTETFTTQPFMSARTPDQEVPEPTTPPILLFRSEINVSTDSLSPVTFPYDVPKPAGCPSGLYLGACDRTSDTLFEDGCELLLPFEFENGWAKQSDFSDLVDRLPHQSLLQSGVNPFNQWHPVQLQGFLEIVYANLRDGHWSVDERGVSGGLDVWKEADTEEKWQNYRLQLAPAIFW
jgi:hypothetical protein